MKRQTHFTNNNFEEIQNFLQFFHCNKNPFTDEMFQKWFNNENYPILYKILPYLLVNLKILYHLIGNFLPIISHAFFSGEVFTCTYWIIHSVNSNSLPLLDYASAELLGQSPQQDRKSKGLLLRQQSTISADTPTPVFLVLDQTWAFQVKLLDIPIYKSWFMSECIELD